jgi:hypothetical protein
MFALTRSAIAAAVLAALPLSATAATGVEERLKALEARLDGLEQENQALKAQLKQAEQKVEATGDRVEKMAGQGSSALAAWAENTQFGGYGELHLNHLDNKRPGGDDLKEADFHRFVLFMGHRFNDRLRFFSELEVEHNTVEGGKGAVELEQAYLDFALTDNITLRGGSFLVPVGIINETHEPPTFYGVERNPVERFVIPATWWEAGGAVSARLGSGITLDGAITTGMNASLADNFAIRDARQELAEGTLAKRPAYTGRLKWTGMPGVELAGTVQYQSDMAQGTDATVGSALLYEAHAAVSKGPFGLRALYAHWDLEGSGPRSVGADKQDGWYVEPSFKFSEQWGAFARYNRWDNQAGDSIDSRFSQWDVGINYWPHPSVVVKLDYQNQKSPAGQDEFDGFNVGLGYQF